MGITLDLAEKLSRAAKEKAQEIDVPMNIAIVDEGANLVSFHRMDNAWLGSDQSTLRSKKRRRHVSLTWIPAKLASCRNRAGHCTTSSILMVD